jgi:hypothetical protein
LEACQYQLDNERPVRTEQLVSAAPSSDDIRFRKLPLESNHFII